VRIHQGLTDQVLVSPGGRSIGHVNIYVWDGNYYTLAVTERLGLEESGGMVRVGPVHYNTQEEIQRFGEALGRIATR
jgi:selenocysteine lyase/cysteine desulfurase